jgi:hypothetical protein
MYHGGFKRTFPLFMQEDDPDVMDYLFKLLTSGPG